MSRQLSRTGSIIRKSTLSHYDSRGGRSPRKFDTLNENAVADLMKRIEQRVNDREDAKKNIGKKKK